MSFNPRATDERDPLIGVELGGFRVVRRLAEGGMGLVYEALHDAIGRRAAVKVLKPEVAQDSEWTRRFLSEARALGALKHRNLVEILNFGKTPDGREFLMMEFLDGEPLDVALHERGAMPLPVALAIADQIANGLSEAHKKGVVHRDLKPSNVHLLREHNGDTLVKVLDFGLARQDPIALANDTSVRVDQSSLLAGTPEYIAPEQAQGKPVDAAADLYSLGVLLFEMVAGERPFSGKDVHELLVKHLSEPAPKLSSRANNVPEALDAIVESLLSKRPDARPPSADALRVELQRLIKQLAREQTAVRPRPSAPAPQPASATPTTRMERSSAKVAPVVEPESRSRMGLVVGFIAAALVAVGITAALWPTPTKPTETPTPTPTPPAPLVPVVVEPVPTPVAATEADAAVEDLALTPLKVVEDKRPVIAKPTCTPSQEWKTRLTLDIAEMGDTQRVVADAALYDVWDRKQALLSKQIAAASTPAQCASAQQAYDKLRAQLGFK